MSKKDEFSFIEENEWYYQGTDYRTMFGISIWAAAFQTFGINHSFAYVLKNHNKGFFSRNYYRRALRPIIAKQLKDKKNIDKLYEKWKKELEKLEVILREIKKIDFEKDDYSKIKKLMIKLDEQNINLWKKSFVSEMLDAEGWDILKNIVNKEGSNVPENELKELTHPENRSYLQDVDLKLLRIAYGLKKKPKNKETILKILKPIVKSYFFTKTGWGYAYILNENDFYKKVREYLKKDAKTIRKEIRKIGSYKKEIRKEKQKVYNKYKFNKKVKNILYFFTVLSEWRDVRKKYAQIVNTYLYYFAERSAKEWNFPLELALESYCQEIKKLPDKLSGKQLKKFKEELVKRKKLNVIYVTKKGFQKPITGAKALQLMKRMDMQFKKQFKEIKGNVGNKGYCKARVRIIKGDKEFHKFRPGDIIVAPMTRPEYTPLMEKAAGIITDEGGLTCHAAIVSRELNIPCVIGTQVATKFLKDNDLVEVDADKGVVRKIK